MSKKMMVPALAVVSAMFFALPAMASAETLHIDNTASFSISGSGGSLTSTEGASISCTSTTGSGLFSTTTGGSMSLLFHGCTTGGILPCTSEGQPSSGTIATAVTFDLITVSSNSRTPGILVTSTGGEGPTSKTILHTAFSCAGIGIKVFGPGVIGTLSSSVCSGAFISTATLTFASTVSGHQEDRIYTGNTFDLSSTISSKHPTYSFDGVTTITFGAARTVTCT